MEAVLLVLLVVVIGVFIVRVAQVAGRPEQAATHPEDLPDDTTSDRFHRGADRPAGPDAEDPPEHGHP